MRSPWSIFRLTILVCLLMAIHGLPVVEAQEASSPAWSEDLVERAAGARWHGIYASGVKLGRIGSSCGSQKDESGAPIKFASEDTLQVEIGFGPLRIKSTETHLHFETGSPWRFRGGTQIETEGWMENSRSKLKSQFRLERGEDGFTFESARFGFERTDPFPDIILTYPDTIAYRLVVLGKFPVGTRGRWKWLDLGEDIESKLTGYMMGDARDPYSPEDTRFEVIEVRDNGDYDLRVGEGAGASETRYGGDGWVLHPLLRGTGNRGDTGLFAEDEPLARSGFDATGAWRVPVPIAGDLGEVPVAIGLTLEVSGAARTIIGNDVGQTVEKRDGERIVIELGGNAGKASPADDPPEDPSFDEPIRAEARRLAEIGRGKAPSDAIQAMLDTLRTESKARTASSAPPDVNRSGRAGDPTSALHLAAKSLGIESRVVEGLVFRPRVQAMTWGTWCMMRLGDTWVSVDPGESSVPASVARIACRRAPRDLIDALPPDDLMVAKVESVSAAPSGIPSLVLFSDSPWWSGLSAISAESLPKIVAELKTAGLHRSDPDPVSLQSDLPADVPLMLVPPLLHNLKMIARRGRWSGTDLELAGRIAEVLKTLPDGPELTFSETASEANVAAVARAGTWFLDQIQKPDRLARMIFTMDDGPFVGTSSEAGSELERVGSIEPEPEPGVEIVLSRTPSGHSVLTCKHPSGSWSRVICRPGPTALPDLTLVRVQNAGECGWVIHMTDGERLHVYCDRNWRFLFYFHSW